MNWFYATKDKTQAGPVDEATLQTLLSAGTITPETLVWKEGMDGWKPYSQALGLPSNPSLTGNEAVCSECGRFHDKSTMIQQGSLWVCSECKPAFLQKLSEGAIVNLGGFHYAGFWIRLAAKFLDGLIIMVVLGIPMILIMALFGFFSPSRLEDPSQASVAVQLILQLVSWVFGAAYSIFFVGKYGATPGKMICQIKIVDASGTPIGYGRATGRFFAEMLSKLICWIGYIMAAFDIEKRALHDRICNTRVIYK